MALAAYLDLTGQAIPPAEQVNGRAFLVENYDPLSALGNWRRGRLDLRTWVSSLRAVDETAWFARDDLRPFGLMCLRMGWRMATRPFSEQPEACPLASSALPGWPRRARYQPDLARAARSAATLQGEDTRMSDTVDVAIIGAGPYGLSLAAHLRAVGVDYRHFGVPMRLWEATMPQGMFLKSQGFASNIADPDGTHTLEAFCQATGRPYASYGLPVSLDNFVSYGHWFQSERGLKIEEVHVDDVTMRNGGFEVSAGGEHVLARRVVVAIGVEAFAYVPKALAGLSSAHCTHSAGPHGPGGLQGPGRHRRRRWPVRAGDGRAAARERCRGAARRQEERAEVERRAAARPPGRCFSG